MKQTVIPAKVVEIAKRILEAKERRETLTIVKTRRCGYGLAIKLANGDQILEAPQASLN